MEYRLLGETGFKVPVLSLGTGTFGGSNDFFKAWGSTDAEGARSLVDIALEAGVSMFDSADVYSDGMAEEILGKALPVARDDVLRGYFHGLDAERHVADQRNRGDHCGDDADALLHVRSHFGHQALASHSALRVLRPSA